MPDIGFFELLLVGAVAFLILGPERTPEFFAQVGRLVRKGRAWIATAKQQIDVETQSLKQPIQEVKDALSDQLDDSLNMKPLQKHNDTERK